MIPIGGKCGAVPGPLPGSSGAGSAQCSQYLSHWNPSPIMLSHSHHSKNCVIIRKNPWPMEGPAWGCLPLPAPFISATWHREEKDRVSQRHLACQFSFLYLVISNNKKSGCRKSVLLALCFALLGRGSWGQLMALLMAGSPCRTWGANRVTKPIQGRAVSMSLSALLFLGPC